MLEKRTSHDMNTLQDPLLSSLLREALADDPALREAPGRTDRIMRKVLASGVRSAPRGFRWASFAWASGAFATAAAAVVLVFGAARLPLPWNLPASPIIANQSAVSVPTPSPITNLPTPVAVTVPKQIAEQPSPRWIAPEATPAASSGVMPEPEPKPAAAVPPMLTENTSRTADVLYAAGKAANAAGDYESAYIAYKAAYDIAPTPDALLASGKALELLAQEALNMGGPAS